LASAGNRHLPEKGRYELDEKRAGYIQGYYVLRKSGQSTLSTLPQNFGDGMVRIFLGPHATWVRQKSNSSEPLNSRDMEWLVSMVRGPPPRKNHNWKKRRRNTRRQVGKLVDLGYVESGVLE